MRTQLAISLALVALPIALNAQTATIVGYPANFDAVNTTGGPTYGFEIEADGIQSSDLTRIFGGTPPSGCLIRYCMGSAVDFPGRSLYSLAKPLECRDPAVY